MLLISCSVLFHENFTNQLVLEVDSFAIERETIFSFCYSSWLVFLLLLLFWLYRYSHHSTHVLHSSIVYLSSLPGVAVLITVNKLKTDPAESFLEISGETRNSNFEIDLLKPFYKGFAADCNISLFSVN